MSTTTDHESGIVVPGMRSQFLEPADSGSSHGRLRYLTGGKGAPLVLLHTVRTQAEHFRDLDRYTVYALAGHFIALERPEAPAALLNQAA